MISVARIIFEIILNVSGKFELLELNKNLTEFHLE